MKVFQNKKIIKRIVFVLLVVTVVGFCYSGKVEAKDDAAGGKLLNPVCDLFVYMGDGAMNIIHGVIYNHYDSTIEIDLISSGWEKALTIAAFIVGAVVVAVAVVFTAGAVVAAAAAIGITLSSIGVGTVLLVSTTAGVIAASVFNSNVLPDTIHLPVYQISPEQIFSNEVLLFDVDFFNPKQKVAAKDSEGNVIKDDSGHVVYLESTAEKLRGVISNWYVILRDIALVALLSVLVYTGIRIIVSSTSSDKAKYKQMLVDWIVAICLLFIMQYIMSFSNIIVGKITELVQSSGGGNAYVGLVEDKDGKVSENLNDLDYDVSSLKIEIEGKNYINWRTNLIGIARLNAQMAKRENTTYAGYALIFFILVLLTIYFIFTYLKRVLYMAFLTIIAPLVAMTYPIDKMKDGKAQAFDMWIKEYIFNLLIQPMHLLLYTVLVTSAFELASKNIIYSLVALGFMIPAEKLLRRFFGFEKAQTPGLLAGPAGAAATMSMMHKLLGMGPKPGPRPGDGGKSNSTLKDSDNGKAPRINSNFSKENAMLDDGDNNIQSSGNNINDSYNTNSQNNLDDRNSTEDNNNLENNENDSENRDRYEELLDDLNNSANDIEPQGQLEAPYYPEEYDENDNNIGLQENNNNQSQEQNAYIDQEQIGEQNPDQDQIRVQNQDQEQNQNNNENINQTNNRNNNTNVPRQQQQRKISKPTFRENFAKNVKSYVPASRYYAKGLVEKAGNRIKNAHPLQTAVKTAGGVVAGTVAAGVGLAAGIASGDPNKAVQYTATATLGGYKLGSNTVSSANRALQVDGMDEMQERLKYQTDEEYKEAKQQEYVRNYQKNLNNQMKLEKKYGRKRGKEIMKTVVPECLDKGITDINDIITINELVDQGHVKDLDMGIATAKYASRVGQDVKSMKEKDKKEWRETFNKEFSKNKNVKDNNMDPDKITDNLFIRLGKFNDIKNSI